MFSILAFWVGTATSVLFFGGFGGGVKSREGGFDVTMQVVLHITKGF